jgi:hypothetical protein
MLDFLIISVINVLTKETSRLHADFGKIMLDFLIISVINVLTKETSSTHTFIEHKLHFCYPPSKRNRPLVTVFEHLCSVTLGNKDKSEALHTTLIIRMWATCNVISWNIRLAVYGTRKITI